jgi:hypothetical protein
VSIRAAVFVSRLRGLPPAEKLIALLIAIHANPKSELSWPSMSTLAEESGLKNRETASRIVKRILAKRVIEISGPISAGGKGRTTAYKINYAFRNCDSPVTVENPETVIPQSQLDRSETVTQDSVTVTLDAENRLPNCDSRVTRKVLDSKGSVFETEQDFQIGKSSSSKGKTNCDDDAAKTVIPQSQLNGNGKTKIAVDEKKDHLTRMRDEALRVIAERFPDETAETIMAVLYVILARRKSNPATANFLVESFRREAEDCQLKGAKLESWAKIARLHRDVEERSLLALVWGDGTSRQTCKLCGSQHKTRESALKCARRYVDHSNQSARGTVPRRASG